MAPQSAHAVPPTLPPSVEEAYRRKCVQLKSRTKEVEEANDAARLRLARSKRQIERLRIERAFLLEQLAKRTSTNVEDSEGSPSPPPTEQQMSFADDKNLNSILNDADANPRKPKEKPLRMKRGNRKAGEDDEAIAYRWDATTAAPEEIQAFEQYVDANRAPEGAEQETEEKLIKTWEEDSAMRNNLVEEVLAKRKATDAEEGQSQGEEQSRESEVKSESQIAAGRAKKEASEAAADVGKPEAEAKDEDIEMADDDASARKSQDAGAE